MMHATIIHEDSIVVADRKDDYWLVTVSDTQTGESRTETMTDVQWQAVVYLMYSDGNNEDVIGQHMYRVCEPLFKDWPKNVRCIP